MLVRRGRQGPGAFLLVVSGVTLAWRSSWTPIWPRPSARRGLPGRHMAAPRRQPHAQPHARGEHYDEGRTREIDGPVDWTRMEAEARKIIESGLELEDRIEAT